MTAVLTSQPLLAQGGLFGDPLGIVQMMLEVTVFAVLIYFALRFLRQTRGSGVIRGLAALLGVGLATWALLKWFQLDRLSLLFDAVAQSVVVALIVVFHPEIRRGITHIGEGPFFSRFFKPDTKLLPRLLRAVARMSKHKVGALIAIEREASLANLIENGITIDAELNSYLLESIFYPKSALHDGGVVVRDDRIVAASCLFPLSQDRNVDQSLGTRHRAALGLSEDTDALVVVVSEETGKISTAEGGKLNHDLTLEQLEKVLEQSLGLRQQK